MNKDAPHTVFIQTCILSLYVGLITKMSLINFPSISLHPHALNDTVKACLGFSWVWQALHTFIYSLPSFRADPLEPCHRVSHSPSFCFLPVWRLPGWLSLPEQLPAWVHFVPNFCVCLCAESQSSLWARPFLWPHAWFLLWSDCWLGTLKYYDIWLQFPKCHEQDYLTAPSAEQGLIQPSPFYHTKPAITLWLPILPHNEFRARRGKEFPQLYVRFQHPGQRISHPGSVGLQ